MSTTVHEGDRTTCSREDRIEAAAWIAKLQGPDRAAELEAGFRRWLAESDGHRAAFEMANEVWGDLATIPKSEHPIRVIFKRRPARSFAPQHEGQASPRILVGAMAARRLVPLAAAASILGVAAAVAFWFLHDSALVTSVGEHRTIALADGSEVTLNTDTRVDLDYDATRRHLRLEHGEALFKVAKDSSRPFVVTTGGHEVVALGTSFVVRRDRDDVAVTLLDGKVSVSTANGFSAAKTPVAETAKSPREDTQADPAGRLILEPGERLVLTRNESPRRDRPPIERMTAWQRGQVNLDHTPLADAIVEMNRYSDAKIVLERGNDGAVHEHQDPGAIQITGIFRAGEPEEFARAIAASYELRLIEEPDRLILSDARH